MPIIALCGTIGSGKDSVAGFIRDYLEEESGIFSAGIYNFSDPLKKMVLGMFQQMGKCLYSFELDVKKDEKITKKGTLRDIYKELAENFLKPHFGEDIFVNLAKTNTRKYPNYKFVIIPDLRFNVELDWLLSENATIIYLHGKNNRNLSEEVLNDKTEKDIDFFKLSQTYSNYHTLDATGTLEETKKRTVELLKKIGY